MSDKIFTHAVIISTCGGDPIIHLRSSEQDAVQYSVDVIERLEKAGMDRYAARAYRLEPVK